MQHYKVYITYTDGRKELFKMDECQLRELVYDINSLSTITKFEVKIIRKQGEKND